MFDTFKQTKQAFSSFIETCKALTEVSKEQTKVMRELNTTIEAVKRNTANLAAMERHRFKRDFPTHEVPHV